jgi:hypothetical protein
LVATFQEKLYWDYRRLTLERLWGFAAAIERTGGADGVWGFIDGTQRRICRPEDDQRSWYSGYVKGHSIKFQGILTPDGCKE